MTAILAILGLDLAEASAFNQANPQQRPKLIAKATDESGSCGEGVNYIFNAGTGELKIFGAGEMREYFFEAGAGDHPWNKLKDFIKSVIIGNGVTSVSGFAFYKYTVLTSAEIAGSVTKIGMRSFQECSNLTSLNIEEGIKSIGSSAFEGCTGLIGSFIIPASVDTINSQAFSGCRGITSLIIPANVSEIGGMAFYWCTNLFSVIYKGTLDPGGESPYYIFEGCSRLKAVNVPTDYKNKTFCGIPIRKFWATKNLNPCFSKFCRYLMF